MENIRLEDFNAQQKSFNIYDNDVKMGEMVISIDDNALTVYHTEVFPEAEGKGYAKLLLAEMVAYARKHHLKVIPLCPFVHLQFRRHPKEYEDLWTEA